MLHYIYVFSLILFINLLIPNPNYSQIRLNQNNNLNSNPRDFNFGSWFSGSKNFFEITYGFGNLKHKNIKTGFNKLIIKEFKFGQRNIKPTANYKLIDFSDNYIFSSYIENNKSINSFSPINISYDIWRFGLGYRKGYGYNFDSFPILPYYQLGLVWNKSNITHPNSTIRTFDDNGILQKEEKLITKYNGTIKFGTTNVAGIDIRVSSLINIGASYETSIIFPYYLVLKQAGSFLIETLSQTGLDYLTEGVIIRAMPDVTPIVYFILKNGLSYFFFTLKQNDMNWPFNTEVPLTFESVKFNVKVTF